MRFLGAQKPPVYIAADFISDEISSLAPAALSKTFYILPTRSAVHNVTTILSDKVLKGDLKPFGGLSLVTPEIFISILGADFKEAGEFHNLSAWISVFKKLRSSDVSGLFPRGLPLPREYPALAKTLSSLRSLLSDVGLRMEDLQNKLQDMDDPRRLADLAGLERRYLSIFERNKVNPPDSLALGIEGIAAQASTVPFDRIVLLGVCDPAPVFLRAISGLREKSVEVCVIADPSDSNMFDEWGRPSHEWASKFACKDDASIAVFSSVAAQASKVAEALAEAGENVANSCAVACGEGDSSKLIGLRLKERGIASYCPRDDSYARDGRISFLGILGNFYENKGMAEFSVLLRSPYMLSYLSGVLGESSENILSAVDNFRENRMPMSFAEFGALAAPGSLERRIFDETEAVFAPKESASIFLEGVFNAFFGEVSDGPDDENAADKVSIFLDASLKALADSEGSLEAALDVPNALKSLREQSLRMFSSPKKDGRSVGLLDWVEIFWEPQSQLLLADMNDGIVPRAPSLNPFLPPAALEVLGLQTSEMRHARDAYMLCVMLESRRAVGGRVLICFPRKNGDGEGAIASRILLQCPAELLPSRVKKLFCNPPENTAALFFHKSWNLKVPFGSLPETLSPSAFKSYLNCPFRFYLDYVLKLRRFDPDYDELDDSAIGTVFHNALDHFSKGKFANSSDESEIAEALSDCLDREFYSMYGRSCSAALAFQLRSLKRRIPAFARKQADLRSRGYRILESEFTPPQIEISGIPIRMRIDRIDVAPDSSLLVIDYKLKDSISGPSAAEDSHHPSRRLPDGSKGKVWEDLQLPLNKAALSAAFPGRKIVCAYFLVSADDNNTGMSYWDISGEEMESALSEAGRIADCILKRRFEPLDKAPKYDNYSGYFDFAGDALGKFLEFEK